MQMLTPVAVRAAQLSIDICAHMQLLTRSNRSSRPALHRHMRTYAVIDTQQLHMRAYVDGELRGSNGYWGQHLHMRAYVDPVLGGSIGCCESATAYARICRSGRLGGSIGC